MLSRRANEFARRNGTFEGAECEIEEFVRQWALSFLIEEYDYPPEWLGERIIIEEPVKMGSTSKQAEHLYQKRNSAYVSLRGSQETGDQLRGVC